MFKGLNREFGINTITTDADKIKPGMIYVDTDKAKDIDFSNVCNKGASLIITEKSVTDNEYPIITVANVDKAFLFVLNSLYDGILQKIRFVPVYSSNKGNIFIEILKAIFRKNYLKGSDTFKLPLDKKTYYIEDFFYNILDCFLQRILIIPIHINPNYQSIENTILQNSDCVIVDEGSAFISEIKRNQDVPIIVNIDDPCALSTIKAKKDSVIITYGLNKKAAITATSIDYGECTCFNYCLQRTFYSKEGIKKEPFEAPFKINGLGINRIYAALASISCALYYDVDLKQIEDSLLDYNDNNKDFLIKKFEEFTLMVCFSDSPFDYNEALETVQFIDYHSLYLIISGNLILEPHAKRAFINTYQVLAKNLNIKETIIVNDTPCNKGNRIFHNADIFEYLGEENLNIKSFGNLIKAVTYVINTIGKQDVLLMLGGDEFNISKTAVELLIQDI